MTEEKRLALSDALNWAEFRVGDLFTQERGKEKAPNQNEDGNIPMINETSANNGFTRNVVPTKVFKGNAITVSINFARVVFYQPVDFCASVNIAILRNEHLNKYNGLYIANVLSYANRKYNYGAKTSKDRLNDTMLYLPATPDGQPDYDFMENYIKQLYDDFADRVCAYTEPVEENADISLSDREWKEFSLQQLFKVTGSKTTAKNDLESIGGNKYPYITTQATNNSVAGFYDYATEKGNCIIAESAVAGFVSYQAKDFSASGHVEKLIPYYKAFNQYHGMFIVSVIRYVNVGKYNYGHKFNQQRIRETMISLPVTPEGQPDYDFMEQYIKQLPFSKALKI